MMKKVLSIVFALFILISGIKVTVSRHYCQGELADSKVSVLGEIASCGMEHSTEGNRSDTRYDAQCCSHTVSVYQVDHNFRPTFSAFKTIAQSVCQVYFLPVNPIHYFATFLSPVEVYTDPPGVMLTHEVSLPEICVFRI